MSMTDLGVFRGALTMRSPDDYVVIYMPGGGYYTIFGDGRLRPSEENDQQ